MQLKVIDKVPLRINFTFCRLFLFKPTPCSERNRFIPCLLTSFKQSTLAKGPSKLKRFQRPWHHIKYLHQPPNWNTFHTRSRSPQKQTLAILSLICFFPFFSLFTRHRSDSQGDQIYSQMDKWTGEQPISTARILLMWPVTWISEGQSWSIEFFS